MNQSLHDNYLEISLARQSSPREILATYISEYTWSNQMTTSRSVRKVMNEKLEKIMVSKTAQEAARKMGTVNTQREANRHNNRTRSGKKSSC